MRLCGKELSARRNGVMLWQHINFGLKSGDLLQITGANGIGKSTLLRVIAGLHKLHHGRLTLELGGAVVMQADCCHYLDTKPAMKEELSVEENLLLWQKFLALDAGLIERALSKLELTELRCYSFADLSAGQKRRASIARLLITPRPVWLLDEPFLCLDHIYKALVQTLMQEHLTHGGIIILASHEVLGLDKCSILNLADHI